MSHPRSNDLRARIVRTVEGGLSRNATAQKFDVSISAVVKLMQHWQATGSYRLKQIGGYRNRILAGHEGYVNRLLAAQPDITLAELSKQLAVVGIGAAQSSIARFLNHLGRRYKKNGARQRTRVGGR
jgi:transposase